MAHPYSRTWSRNHIDEDGTLWQLEQITVTWTTVQEMWIHTDTLTDTVSVKEWGTTWTGRDGVLWRLAFITVGEEDITETWHQAGQS